jgi:hypothetical protein
MHVRLLECWAKRTVAGEGWRWCLFQGILDALWKLLDGWVEGTKEARGCESSVSKYLGKASCLSVIVCVACSGACRRWVLCMVRLGGLYCIFPSCGIPFFEVYISSLGEVPAVRYTLDISYRDIDKPSIPQRACSLSKR